MQTILVEVERPRVARGSRYCGGICKPELVVQLAAQQATAASRSVYVCPIVPDKEWHQRLLNGTDEAFERLHAIGQRSTGAARANMYARDVYVAYACDRLGKDVVVRLNKCFQTSLSYNAWAARHRRGQLLLQFPALAFQGIIPLDERPGRLTPSQLRTLLEGNAELKQMHDDLRRDFPLILGAAPTENKNEEEQQDEHSDLHIDGFTVMRGLFADLVPDYADDFTHAAKDAQPIFNNQDTDHAENDKRRLQLGFGELKGPAAEKARSFQAAVEARLRALYGIHVVQNMFLLRSLPGCLGQRAHTDYCPGQVKNRSDAQMPLACVIALRDDTCLDVWPGAIRFDEVR
jgi:hypothetical protein